MSTPLASGETFLQNYQGLGKYICDLFSLRRFFFNKWRLQVYKIE